MNQKMPYFITQFRYDVVVKVPDWATEYIEVGDVVRREADEHVVLDSGIGLRLGESYTKFLEYR